MLSEVMKMKKTSLLLTLGLALMLASAAAPKTNAEVVVGVGVGEPVYVRPVHPYPYVVAAPYVAPARVYYRNWYPRH